MPNRKTSRETNGGTSRRATTTTPASGARADAAVPLLLGIELVRADIARTLLGWELGDAPCGGPITWALYIDGVVVGRTDEPLTDEAAQAWARRLTGEGVGFQLAHRAGGYWLADTTEADTTDAGDGDGPLPGEGGWPR